MAYNVVILGCGRSGTSIFGELFDALPAFEYHSEPLLADLRLTAGAGAIAVKVPRSLPSATPPAGAPCTSTSCSTGVPPPRRVGRWRENLTADDLAAAMPIVAEGAAWFGYDLA